MKPKIVARLLFLAEMYQEQLSETRITGYVEALSDLDEGDVLQAMDRALKTQTYFPRVAELREIAAQIRRDRYRLQKQAEQRRSLDEMRNSEIATVTPLTLPDPDAPRSQAGQPRSFREILRAAAEKRRAGATPRTTSSTRSIAGARRG